MSRRDDSPTLTIISWRDIPAQVTAKKGRQTAKIELSQRFQVAIDRAAMYAGLFGTDDYLTEWKRESRPCGDDIDLEVAFEAERIEEAFTSEVLSSHWNNGGFKP
ncbi:MAG: virulence factor [Acidimicrobiia bacterium]